MGAPDDVIAEAEERARAPVEEEAFGVFEENWSTFILFCSLQTRWNVVVLPSGRIRRVGLNWPAVESKVNRTIPRKDRPALLDELELLELEALKVFSEQV